MRDLYKYPRLYLNNGGFTKDGEISISDNHVHYLRNVLRLSAGDYVRVFNGIDGERLSIIKRLEKKNGILTLQKCILPQKNPVSSVHLLFSPIKKQRMDFLIEKSVELGVTALHPVITNRTEVRRFNESKTLAHIIEASEQCERMDIPLLAKPVSLPVLLSKWRAPQIAVCLERENLPPLSSYVSNIGSGDCAFLVGPEGGFDDREIELIKSRGDTIMPVTLGDRVLRSETASIMCLSYYDCENIQGLV